MSDRRNTRTEELTGHEPRSIFHLAERGFSKTSCPDPREPRSLANVVRREILAVDPRRGEHIQTMETSRIARFADVCPASAGRLLAGRERPGLWAFTAVSLSVGSRTKEIAVRVAIGASVTGFRADPRRQPAPDSVDWRSERRGDGLGGSWRPCSQVPDDPLTLLVPCCSPERR